MKLVSFLPLHATADDLPKVGVLAPDGVADVTEYVSALPPHRAGGISSSCLMLRLLSAGPAALAALATRWASAPSLPIDAVLLLAPIPRPGKIIAVGRNYADHLEEMADAVQTAPRLIFKLPSSVIGPDSLPSIPKAVQQLDFEVELAVVIGTRVARVAREQALDYVAGYTILNDLSAREF